MTFHLRGAIALAQCVRYVRDLATYVPISLQHESSKEVDRKFNQAAGVASGVATGLAPGVAGKEMGTSGKIISP
jgi:hypothetical protein